mmetsp:Transcript_50415/g.114546  ORF Transcript_50415/g.114546 Transcript_50415/m.114546 type:complete len:266 (+) Transcript_50415:144-941(+)
MPPEKRGHLCEVPTCGLRSWQRLKLPSLRIALWTQTVPRKGHLGPLRVTCASLSLLKSQPVADLVVSIPQPQHGIIVRHDGPAVVGNLLELLSALSAIKQNQNRRSDAVQDVGPSASRRACNNDMKQSPESTSVTSLSRQRSLASRCERLPVSIPALATAGSPGGATRKNGKTPSICPSQLLAQIAHRPSTTRVRVGMANSVGEITQRTARLCVTTACHGNVQEHGKRFLSIPHMRCLVGLWRAGHCQRRGIDCGTSGLDLVDNT